MEIRFSQFIQKKKNETEIFNPIMHTKKTQLKF